MLHWLILCRWQGIKCILCLASAVQLSAPKIQNLTAAISHSFHTSKKFEKGFLISIIQVLREILKEVQMSMVPRMLLKEWAAATFKSATDYWTFRKMFTLQMALAGFAEYVLHLSRLNPDMLYIHQVSIFWNCFLIHHDKIRYKII